MIVPMKKVFVIVQEKDAQEALVSLRYIGIVHLEHEKQPIGNTLNELKENIQMLEKAILILQQYVLQAPQISLDNWKEKLKEVFGYLMQLHELRDQAAKRRSLIQRWEPWGAFEPEDIHALSSAGVHVYLFEIPAKELYKIPQKVSIQIISKQKGVVRCMVLPKEKLELPFSPCGFPPASLNQMKLQQEDTEKNIKQLENTIKGFYQ